MNPLPQLLFPRSPRALVGMGAGLLNGLLRVAVVPLSVTPVVDRVLARGDLAALPEVLGLAAAAIVGMSLMLLCQDAFLGLAAAETSAGWRREIYGRLLARTPGTLPGSSGGLAGRIVADLKDVESYLQFGLGTLVAESVTLLSILAVLFYRSPGTTLLLTALSIPLVLALRWLGGRLEQAADRSQASTEAVATHLQEGLRHHAVVRAFAALPFFLRRFEVANAATRNAMGQRSLLAALQTPTAQVLIFGAMSLIVALLARSVAEGSMTVGQVVEYLALLALLSTPTQLLPKGYALLQQARAAGTRLRELRSDAGSQGAPGRSPDASPPQARAVPGGTSLELQAVDFGYAPDRPLLKGASLALPERGLVALVGESGAGKSTLLHLFLGFLLPDAGAVLLGGRPLAAIPEAELRSQLGYVPQGNDLFHGSIRDNLLIGREAPDEALWAVLEASGLGEEVVNLPGRLDHLLREDGTGLSGGQRQRLALARALLDAPGILLLDEPSSHLDADGERVLIETLRRQATERLVLVVAHRTALIDVAEQVWELTPAGILIEKPALRNGRSG